MIRGYFKKQGMCLSHLSAFIAMNHLKGKAVVEITF